MPGRTLDTLNHIISGVQDRWDEGVAIKDHPRALEEILQGLPHWTDQGLVAKLRQELSERPGYSFQDVLVVCWNLKRSVGL